MFSVVAITAAIDKAIEAMLNQQIIDNIRVRNVTGYAQRYNKKKDQINQFSTNHKPPSNLKKSNRIRDSYLGNHEKAVAES